MSAMAQSENKDETDSSEPSGGKPDDPDALTNYTVRLSASDRARLAAAAKKHRKDTGSRESATSLARTFILTGLQAFERHGSVQVTS